MLGYNLIRNSVIFIILINCLLPFTLGFHRHRMRHGRQFNRRSPNDSKKISVTVTKIVKNNTPPTSNGGDPKLKTVNTMLGPDALLHTRSGGAAEKSSNLNRNLSQPAKVASSVTTANNNNEEKLLDTKVFKTLLRDLLERLDTFGTQKETFPYPVATDENPFNRLNPVLGGGEEGPRHINSRDAHHCILHGLWLSTVAGAAIELIPEQKQGHIEIHTRIFELPDNPFPSLINSQWTGKGIISQESPTTITVVFQEHIETEKENHAKERGLEKDAAGDKHNNNDDDASITIQLPRTAVFVGQCLVCQGNPTLQGAWVVFPASQTCTAGAGFATGNHGAGGEQTVLTQQMPDSLRMTTQDAIYLLKYY